MKTLQTQYNLIKEGKGDKAYFMKLARYNFPDLVTPVLSYNDTITVLKNKSILSEGIGGVVNLKEEKETKAEEKETTKEVTDMATRGYDYKDTKNYDNVFGQEFLKGFYTEMQDPKNEDKTVEELRAIVAKNLVKDLNYYVKDGQFGLKGVGYTVDVPGLGEPKPAKGKHKSSGYGDLKESVLRSQIYLLAKEILSEGIHDKDITSAPHTNIKGKMGDYDPKSRAANLASLANFGPKSKPENNDEALNKPTEEEKNLNALKEKALKLAGEALMSIGTNTHKVVFNHDGKTVAIAFRDSEEKANKTAEKLKKTGLLNNVKVTSNK